jgi:hypothetical protein
VAPGRLLEPALTAAHAVWWASEATAGVAGRVVVEMKGQAHHEDIWRPVSGYLTSLLADIERGNSLYPPYIPHLGTEVAIAKEDSSRKL